MIELVQQALKERGIDENMFTLEHGIHKVLDKHNLSMEDLGLKGCTLYYRRRAIDMPLSPMATDTPEKLEKAQMVRQKILTNFQTKYLFNLEPCSAPVDKIVNNGSLQGIRFQRTKIENNRVVPLDEFYDKKGSQVISSIGSIPEKIEGIPSEGNVFKISNPESCQIDGFDNVFAIGNAVTGKGNINESVKHGREVSAEIMDSYLAWTQQDYENWHRSTAVKVNRDIAKIVEVVEKAADGALEEFLGIHFVHIVVLQRVKSGFELPDIGLAAASGVRLRQGDRRKQYDRQSDEQE